MLGNLSSPGKFKQVINPRQVSRQVCLFECNAKVTFESREVKEFCVRNNILRFTNAK